MKFRLLTKSAFWLPSLGYSQTHGYLSAVIFSIDFISCLRFETFEVRFSSETLGRGRNFDFNRLYFCAFHLVYVLVFSTLSFIHLYMHFSPYTTTPKLRTFHLIPLKKLKFHIKHKHYTYIFFKVTQH